MTITEIPSAEALAVRAGVVEWVSDPGSEVAAGDVILKIKGSARLQAAVDKETTALEKYQLDLETAEAREEAEEDDAAKAAIEANVTRKQADLDAAMAKLAPFVVRAPIDGVVEVLVKARDKVKVDQPIGKVTGTAKAVAVFTLADGNFAAENEEYVVEAIDDAELKTTCIVSKVLDQEITLECPMDSGIAADAAVKLVAAVETEEE
jgi:multidrug efflux pump subunit AcrA (membrane-fusion protein)